MANEIEIVVTGVNRFGSTITDVNRQVRGLSRTVDENTESTRENQQATEESASSFDRLKERSTEVAAVLGVALVAGIGKAVSAASDLQQATGGVESIFKTSSAEIQKWGDTAAESAGLSKAAFLTMAAPLGASLKLAGLSMDEVTKKTITLTQRAADMAATFGGTTAEALEAIGSALKGEADPIERYGVGLNEAAVGAKALAMTGKQAASAITDQEKAAARIAIVLDQTADSAGQFARENSSAAGSAEIAKAKLEDAAASLGTSFLPIAAKAASAVGDMAKAFGSLPSAAQLTIVALTGIGIAALALLPRIAAMKVALVELGITSKITAAGMKTLAGALAGVVAAVVGLQLIGDAIKSIEGRSAGIDQMTKSLTELAKTGKAGGDFAETWGSVWDRAGTASEKFGDAVRETFDPTFWETYWLHPIGEVTSILPGMTSNMDALAEKFSSVDKALAGMVAGGKTQEAADAFNILSAEAQKAGFPVERLKELFPEYVDASKGAVESNKAIATTAGAAAKKVETLEDAFKSITDTVFASEEATDAYEDALDSAAESVKENKKTLDEHTDAGRANRSALRDIAARAHDVLTQMDAMKAPIKNVSAAARDQRAAFVSTARQMGLTKTEANKLADAYGLIPKRITTTVIANTGAARGALNSFLSLLGSVDGRTANVGVGTVLARAHGGIIGAAASGGPRSAMTLVGEQGPELVNLPFGSNVIPAGTTRERFRNSVSTSMTSSSSGDSGMASTVADLTRAIHTLSDLFDKLSGKATDSTRATIAYEEALDRATAATKENGKTLSLTTEKGRANRSALLDIADAAQNVLEAMEEHGSSLTAIAEKARKERAAFITAARRMGMSAHDAGELATDYGLSPTRVTASVKKARADAAYNKTLTGKASGGIAGGSTWVGEHGPELVDLPQGSLVFPSGQSAGMAGGSAGGPLHITLKIGNQELGDLLIDPLRKTVRTRGGNVQAVLGS